MSVVLPEEGPSTKRCKSMREDCPDYSLTNIYALYSATCLHVCRKGKVSDLVRQFDETDSGPGVSGGGGGGGAEGKEESTPRKRKKPGLKAFKMFESSGIIMGMVSSYVRTYLYVISY